MSTGNLRYDFQIAAVAHAKGIALNVGCGDDPAGLRWRFGSKVLNCDMHLFDEFMGRPNTVDKIFNMVEIPWEFGDDYADVVIFGDVFDGPLRVIVNVLREARRVGRELCITAPEDKSRKWVINEQFLRDALGQAGWAPYIFIKGDWGFTDDKGDPVLGHCLMAHRI